MHKEHQIKARRIAHARLATFACVWIALALSVFHFIFGLSSYVAVAFLTLAFVTSLFDLICTYLGQENSSEEDLDEFVDPIFRLTFLGDDPISTPGFVGYLLGFLLIFASIPLLLAN